MINAAMYFALGFLTAGLLALVLGPAVWRRAVRLTRRSIEATSPMSLAEARAARDQLRAEYAVKTRRLELGAEGLKERMIRQELDITQIREALKSAKLERDEKARIVREMELREAGLRDEILARQEDISRLSARLRETERNLERRSQQIADLSKIEPGSAARPATPAGSVNLTIAELEEEIAGHKARHTADATKILRLESEVASLQRKLAEIGRRPDGAARDTGPSNAAIQKLESMILDLEGQKVESQAEITRLSLQYEALRGAAGDNVEGVLASLEAENTALAEELNRLSSEHEQLQRRIKSLSEEEDRETDQLREQITDLAAQIVAMTAAMEGGDAASGDGDGDAPVNGKPANGAGNGADAPRTSLADRIRDLRAQIKPDRQKEGAEV